MNMKIGFRGGFRFDISSRGHTIISDQPAEYGGGDAGMTPVELFVASLGSCIGYFIARYYARHQMPSEGLRMEAEYSFVEQPHRVGTVELLVHLPAPLSAIQEQALLKVAHGCTVHQSLNMPPKVDIRLVSEKV